MEAASRALLALVAVILLVHLIKGTDGHGANGPAQAKRWLGWLITGNDTAPELAPRAQQRGRKWYDTPTPAGRGYAPSLT